MKKIATREAYGEALKKLGGENKDIVVLDADLSKSTKTDLFAKTYPERFFDMGVAEQNLMGTAAGFAAAGKIAFASSFAVFASGRAFEQVRNSIAYNNLNVKIGATHAGITVGEDGASHQSIEDIAIMRSLPNMTVIVPADGVETEQVVKAAVEHNGPVYLRLGRLSVPILFDENYHFKIGKAATMRDGSDVTVIACGVMVELAIAAAETLQSQGISVRVLNMASIKPIDAEAIEKAARETGAIVTAEEHNVLGGLGSAVAEVTGETFPVPVLKVGMQDTFGESGTPTELMQKYGLTSEKIIEAVKKAVNLKKK